MPSDPDRPVDEPPVGVLQASIVNNAQGCHRVCESDGIVGVFAAGMWSSPVRTPPLYPDAIALAAQTGATQLLAAVDGAGPGCSVKDSFANLDLCAYGLHNLFDASWLALGSCAPGPATRFGLWRTIDTGLELAGWITAYGDEPHRFAASLLEDPRVSLLAGHRGGRQVAGAIVFRSAGVAAVSNLFGPDDSLVDVWSDVARLVLDTVGGPVVAYDRGASLAAAETVGFRRTGPLTVWSGAVAHSASCRRRPA